MTVKRRPDTRGHEVQFIREGSARKFAVLPIEVYEAMLAELEMVADIRAYDGVKARNEETVPFEMAKRLIAGESPIRVWREHRGLTITELASKTGLSRSHLAQVESGKRRGSGDALRAIATALGLDLDDIAT
jgi:DNA-binding XRE family transcriptional regulator